MDELRNDLAEILPKSAHSKINAIMEAFAAYVPTALHLPGGHVEVERIDHPGLSIGLDASGNAVAVHLDGTWDVEYEQGE